ncbi:hypothetical protein DOE51_10155 [Bdellovibrio sp. NC01]|nr:hypothetical protein DOE51_10155 [Bdellovibrio sp. NC01]
MRPVKYWFYNFLIFLSVAAAIPFFFDPYNGWFIFLFIASGICRIFFPWRLRCPKCGWKIMQKKKQIWGVRVGYWFIPKVCDNCGVNLR